MIDIEQIKRNILSDMRVELTEEFDKNFERKKFFTTKWRKRSYQNPKGSLLMVTGTLRRSIKSVIKNSGVRFSSSVAYASIHNEGGKGTKTVKAHQRRSRKGKQYAVKTHSRKFSMPKRQFVGDGKRTQEIIKIIIDDNISDFDMQLTKFIKK